VVGERTGSEALDPRVGELLQQGLLDALQLHGEEQAERCFEVGFPYYKAVRIRGPEEVQSVRRYRCPRVLADAWSEAARGGTGQRIQAELAAELAGQGPLWLAGGLGPDNIREVIRLFNPELIDASSRLERFPGQKDRTLMERYFAELEAAGEEA